LILAASVCLAVLASASPAVARTRWKEFSVPTPASGPYGITAGPDGNVWFTEAFASKIGRITPAGAFTEFPLPTAGSDPSGITPGPDRHLWFTELEGNKIGAFRPHV
jgi:virginiamycin B lyase